MNFICNLLLFLFVCSDTIYSQVHYYIRPSLNVPCPGDPCLTLEQFAPSSTSYIDNETNISLSFLPGNHNLDRELALYADNFSMTKDIGGNGTVFVECGSLSGRFDISETILAMIKVHFIDCGGNRVSQVEQFIVEDTTFQGVEGRGTALMLNEVSAASIARSLFLSNTHGSTFEQHDMIISSQAMLNYLYFNRNPLIAVGGALYTIYSNVSIGSSKFIDNTTEIEGALFAYNSSPYIVGSTYSYNKASFAGVMITSESSVNIDNCTFSKNAAEMLGGVMVTYRDSFNLSGNTFTKNNAHFDYGVIQAYESLFDIKESTFSGNTADRVCEVIYADGSFSINSSTFIKNSAGFFGGVMIAFNSSFNTTSMYFY